ncbi:cysteine--tRNA ligase [Buchnera aphidicola (Ceratoglyphina bambusae)]|uniref:cysteine--tRNA ligase n=1 Tax=Buchnera aphidicola TaxID=9 RepID=UPI0031B8ACD9
MLKIFNALKNIKETFKTFFLNKVYIYVCGITVYDICHIGHGRTFVVFDMIIRYLKHIGYKVKYVRNITDVDDKIINRLIENKANIKIFIKRMIKDMHSDFNNLNIIPPNVEPRVTENIKIIIKFIEKLLLSNHAYISSNGDVMFSISSFKKYGQLSNQVIKNLKSYKIKKNKNKKLDFVLWKIQDLKKFKSSAYNYNFLWKSPWGIGRPGWHIECSALSYKYCGNLFDIHGGGYDLLFPHHENERSQSSCFLNNDKYVNYWMHSGLLILNNKKMSKSIGNNYSLKQAILDYDPETIRYFFLSSHYRKPLIYKNDSFKIARLSMERLYYAILNTKEYNYDNKESKYFEKKFKKSMDDDFNTPKAISILFDISKKINIEKKNNVINANILATKLKFLGKILGLFFLSSDIFFREYNFKVYKKRISIYKINILIKIRNFCRKKRNWIKSDLIRNKISSFGIILEDSYNNTFWKINN